MTASVFNGAVMNFKFNKPNVDSGPAGAIDDVLGQPTDPAGTAPSKLNAALIKAGMVTAKPTVATNAGASANSALSRAFELASIREAEYLRLPAPGARCRLTGLSRTGLNELIAANLVRAVKVRKNGSVRGVVLICRTSLLDYLARLDFEQNGTALAEGDSL